MAQPRRRQSEQIRSGPGCVPSLAARRGESQAAPARPFFGRERNPPRPFSCSSRPSPPPPAEREAAGPSWQAPGACSLCRGVPSTGSPRPSWDCRPHATREAASPSSERSGGGRCSRCPCGVPEPTRGEAAGLRVGGAGRGSVLELVPLALARELSAPAQGKTKAADSLWGGGLRRGRALFVEGTSVSTLGRPGARPCRSLFITQGPLYSPKKFGRVWASLANRLRDPARETQAPPGRILACGRRNQEPQPWPDNRT